VRQPPARFAASKPACRSSRVARPLPERPDIEPRRNEGREVFDRVDDPIVEQLRKLVRATIAREGLQRRSQLLKAPERR